MNVSKEGRKLISIIIPAYNEGRYIGQCIESLIKQTVKNFEIIVIDDGSTDDTKKIAENFDVSVISIFHAGPGQAKKEGIKFTRGEILVFFDADMYAAHDYIEKLIQPIINKKSVGTFSTAEYIGNTDNVWSQCWNINNNLPLTRRQKERDHLHGKVFRAILKNEYFQLGGFDSSQGYEDDMSLSKDNTRAFEVKDAICYHNNPESLSEVFVSARWIGRSPKLSFNIKNLLRYSIFNSLRFSFLKIRKGAPMRFIFFKVIFDFGILAGIFFKNSEKNFSK